MKLSLSNGVFSKLGLQENFETVRRLGFENIEFNMKTVKRESDTAVYGSKKLLSDSNLRCLTVHSATLHVKDQVEVHRAVYYGKISLEFAKMLSASVMTVHSDVSKKLPKSTRNNCLAEIFTELNQFANKLGIKLALENLSYTSTGFGKDVESLEEILEIVDDGNMGITIDFCHALETKRTDSLVEKYGSRVCNVHMADKAHKPFSEENQVLTKFLSRLDDFEYDGPITLEVAHGTSTEEILKSKALFEKILPQD